MMKNNIILKSFVFIFSNIILFLGLDGFLNFAGLQSINKCILLVQLSLLVLGIYFMSKRISAWDYSILFFCCIIIANSYLMSYDSQLSTNLKAGEKLIILGYPLGLGASSSGVKPSYSSAEVARDGLADGGYILTTSTGFEHGNSGGPVFTLRNGKQVVIGLCSGANNGSDGTHRKGRIIPIGAAFN